MKSKKLIISPALRRYANYLIVLSVLFYSKQAFTQGTSCPNQTGEFNCTLLASTSFKTGQIYDDRANYNFEASGFTNGNLSDCEPWNCGSHFLLAGYTDSDVTLTFGFNSHYSLASTIISHNIIIKNLTSGATMVNTFTGVGGSSVPRPDDSSFVLNSPNRGEYQIKYYRVTTSGFTATPGTDSADITGIVVLQPQIQRLWLTAPPICNTFSDSKYYFQINSIPPLDSVIVPSHAYSLPTGSTDCADPLAENYIALDFTSSTIPINQGWSFPGDFLSPVCVPGNGWAVHSLIYPDTAFGPLDLNGYWINSSDLAPFISGGITPIINLSFSDGIATSFLNTVDLIIEYPAIPATSYLGTAGIHSIGPPNATGIPWPSYDIYDYTVSGAEIWTKTNNPISDMNGDVTDSIVRIQNNLTIPPGSSLTLVGMSVQFGPSGGLYAYPATDSLDNGGYLNLSSSTLTAYRGCDGTDHSTWSGLMLYGNPLFPDEVSGISNPQGTLVMENSTISYAAVGIQNGNLFSGLTGGMINAGYGGNTFYNNEIAVELWPYNPGLHTGVVGTEINFGNSRFINDTHAWFTSPEMFFDYDCGPVFIHNCLFSNRTRSTIQQAIMGLESSMTLNSDVFDSFYYGVNYNNISGTHSLALNSSTFTGNNVGLASIGATTPIINSNIFNVPAYSGAGPTDSVGTDALVVIDQNIGAYLNANNGYSLWNNSFGSRAGSDSFITGTLEFNSGSSLNQVTGNTFHGLGTAMLSNYNNSGLQYNCNIDSNVVYDIAVLGAIPVIRHTAGPGGIYSTQGTVSSGSTTPDLPAGNIFAGAWNIFNFQQPITYIDLAGTPNQDPVIYVYGSDDPSGLTADCYTPPGSLPFLGFSLYASTATFANSGFIETNINHYMTDSQGVQHRDSLYYWAGQVYTPYGDLLTTNLLIEDNYTDSAIGVYDNIISKYSLDSSSQEGNDFVQGRYLIEMLIYKKSIGEPLLTLDSEEVSILKLVKANTSMWAHARAEGLLYVYEGDSFTDTLLYPNVDTLDDDRRSNPNGSHGSTNTLSSILPVEKSLVNQIYPNPVHDDLEVIYTAQTNQAVSIEIEDISGRDIITQPIQSGQITTIDVSKLVPGMYLYRIMEGGNVTLIGKVAKD